MTNPIHIDLDLDAHLFASGYSGPDDEGIRPATLEDIVIGAVADTIVRRVISDQTARQSLYDNVRTQVAAIRNDEILAQLRPIITEAVNGPIVPTNNYGEPMSGATTTLREMIVKEGTAQLAKRASTSGRFDKQPTVLETIIADQVGKALQKELRDAVDAAKGEVVALLRAQAAAVLTETLQRAAKA